MTFLQPAHRTTYILSTSEAAKKVEKLAPLTTSEDKSNKQQNDKNQPKLREHTVP